MFIDYQLGRILMEERIAQAERTRLRQTYRRHLEDTRRAETRAEREAEIVELTFGTHCGIDQIGA